MRRFFARLSGSTELQREMAEIVDEEVAPFRANWANRVKRINEAELGERFFRSDWWQIPESLA